MTKYLKVYFWRIFHIKIKAVESLKNVEIFPKVYQKYLQTGRIFLTKKVEGKEKFLLLYDFNGQRGGGSMEI